jgi:hypothetical protein
MPDRIEDAGLRIEDSTGVSLFLDPQSSILNSPPKEAPLA